MSTESLKLELIEHLMRTNNVSLLKKALELFHANVANEDELTDEHFDIVKEREAAYKRGEGKNYTWEEAKAMIRSGKGKNA